MGQTLSEPVTTKISATYENSRLRCGCSSMQGWRITMEDAHTVELRLGGDENVNFFAVFDGHGGRRISDYASRNLHLRLINNHKYQKGAIEDSLRQSFMQLDDEMHNSEDLMHDLAGTTAIAILIKSGKMYCANVGDSRAVISYAGHAVPISRDHKPNDADEQRRILAGGGWVEFNRVNGNLALSRAFGDFNYKRNKSRRPEDQIVTAYPELSVTALAPEIEFLVIACDGIWDVLTNSEVIDFCRRRIAKQMEPAQICEELMDQCLAPDRFMGGLGCDNMTVQLVCFLNDEPYTTLASRCAALPSKTTPLTPTFF
ncbi:probable protein phosphatase 2C T23F11.1 [Symsagittifera roscoffensis]|uniref:probable protein phosphatase 2C T23F11.1 n=1 Tax=Symsagittifera roscoffensis TaxID=84072 RepID=UPI00307C3E3D